MEPVISNNVLLIKIIKERDIYGHAWTWDSYSIMVHFPKGQSTCHSRAVFASLADTVPTVTQAVGVLCGMKQCSPPYLHSHQTWCRRRASVVTLPWAKLVSKRFSTAAAEPCFPPDSSTALSCSVLAESLHIPRGALRTPARSTLLFWTALSLSPL